jgi:hypothetical protein
VEGQNFKIAVPDDPVVAQSPVENDSVGAGHSEPEAVGIVL